jgi:hypothetical protein
MKHPCVRKAGVAAVFVALTIGLGACSSSFGGGGSAPKDAVVLPPGARVVCADGSAPPCHY